MNVKEIHVRFTTRRLPLTKLLITYCLEKMFGYTHLGEWIKTKLFNSEIVYADAEAGTVR